MFDHGIPASITLAQGLLESDNGNSALARYANNHFGIKCHAGWKGDTYIQNDDKPNECFRKYKTAEESFEDHSEFLKTRGRYAFLFELRKTDYKGWAEGLQEAGYATNRNYAKLLIKIIEENNLYQYDRVQELTVEKKKKKDPEPPVIMPSSQPATNVRKIYLNNNVKYIVAQEGDTYYKIARQLDMRLWQLHNYNETGKQTCLQAGDIVYLQPKRRKSYKEEVHTVRLGETMYSISQLYGIKVKHLYRLNEMQDGQEPSVGQKIFLKKRKKNVSGKK